jgi:hypothetical protein
MNAFKNNWHQFKDRPYAHALATERMSKLHSPFFCFLITRWERILATICNGIKLMEVISSPL